MLFGAAEVQLCQRGTPTLPVSDSLSQPLISEDAFTSGVSNETPSLPDTIESLILSLRHPTPVCVKLFV